MNLEEVDRELDALGVTPRDVRIETLDGGLEAVDAALTALGEGASIAPPSTRARSQAPSPARSAAPPPPPPKSSAPKLGAPRPPPPRIPSVPKPASKPAPSITQQEVPPESASSPGALSADELFADLAEDDAIATSEVATPESTPEGAGAAASSTHEVAAPSDDSPLADLFGDLDEEVDDGLDSLFDEPKPTEDRLSLELDDLEEAESESTSLFSAADVAAIRRASSLPAPPSAAPSEPVRRPFTAPPPPPASVAPRASLDELMLDDEFELLIDDEDEAESAESTFVGQADEIEAAIAASAPAEPVEGEAGTSDDDEPDDPSGEKKGFFKKLFG